MSTGSISIVEAAEPEVTVERLGAVAVVRLNRPAVLNAMTIVMANLYADTMRALDEDSAVRAIVVTGSGRGFCSGADLRVLNGGAEELRKFVPPRENLPDLTLKLRTPVVTAVNGPVAGIGFAYMMFSDVRFAALGASISTTFARLGLVAEYGLSWLLPRTVGVGCALDLLISGRTLTGGQAHQLGLVQYVVPDDEILVAALAYAQTLAERCSPASMATMKAQVYGDLSLDADAAMSRTLTLMDESIDYPDLAEALAARRENRAVEFAHLL